MPYRVTNFQDTPNPNAVKCLLDRPIRDPGRGPGSYRTAQAAADDPVAVALFSIPGVTNLLINADWLTVSKEPGVPWKTIQSEVRRVLGELP